MNKTDSYKNLQSHNIDNSILDLQNENLELKRQNQIVNNRLNTLETKYNILNNDYNNVCKSYDEIFLKIQSLEDAMRAVKDSDDLATREHGLKPDKINNKQDIPKTNILKKSTTLKK